MGEINEQVVLTNGTFPRIAPYALFMAFVGLEQLFAHWANNGGSDGSVPAGMYLYPAKTVAVALLLVTFKSCYTEVCLRDLLKFKHSVISIISGIVVFLLWINMDWHFTSPPPQQGFNPGILQDGQMRTTVTIVRMTGAVIVVPIMEELFWRSFLIRYIINQTYAKISIGQFSWSSFLITTIFFGFEHQLVLAGIMAGAAYNLLLYYSKSIAQCILAHAVTNLALGIYVITTGQWHFW